MQLRGGVVQPLVYKGYTRISPRMDPAQISMAAEQMHISDMLAACRETWYDYRERQLCWKAVLLDEIARSKHKNQAPPSDFIRRKVQHYAEMLQVCESEEQYWISEQRDLIIRQAKKRAGMRHCPKPPYHEPLTHQELTRMRHT